MKAVYCGRLSEKREFILACANFFIKRLGIQNSKKDLIFLSRKEADFDVSDCYGATTICENTIYVYVNPYLNMANLLNVIAHEMVHVAQLARGHLVKILHEDQTINFWCGKKIEEIEYEELPWEKKAFALQDSLACELAEIMFQGFDK